MKRIIRLIALVILILFGCAKEGMPPGGPEDRTAPEIVYTKPSVGQTQVDPETSVLVRFSEPINQASAKDAVFISPYPGKKIKIRWRGRILKIHFPKPLKVGQTYVITLGTAIRDYRNNPMKSSFTLAFSTGEILDQGEISGRVYGKGDQKTIDIWAYRFLENVAPNPSQKEPDYIVQCDNEGAFRLCYLAPSRYRLFAVKDRAADRLYQSGEDEIGVPFCDVNLSDKNAKADNIFFRMSVSDTLNPALVRATSLNRNHVIVQFSEPVFISGMPPFPPFSIVSLSDTTDTLSIEFFYSDPVQSKLFHLYTEEMSSNATYDIRVENIADKAGNPIDSEYNTMQFGGTGESDTTRPELSLTRPAFRENTVNPLKPLRLCFNEAMDSIRFPAGCAFKDSTGQTVHGMYRWPNPAECTFSPNDPLASRSHYSLLLSDSCLDVAGNGLPDTVLTFRTINMDTLSEIIGTVFDRDTTAEGKLVVTATQIKNAEISYSTILPQPGPYRIDSVLPGMYLLDAFRDENGDHCYTTGAPYPFIPSERFIVYEDTVKIRSRWPNEGNNLRLP